jgi:hypothetical protein
LQKISKKEFVMMKKNMLFLLVGSMSIVSFVANANTVTVTNEYRKPIIIRFNGKDFKIGGSGGRQTVGFIQDMMSLDLKSETEKNFTSLANVVKQIKTEAASHPRARVAVIIPNTFSLTLTGWKPARIMWDSNLSSADLAKLGVVIQKIRGVAICVNNHKTDSNRMQGCSSQEIYNTLYGLKGFLEATNTMDVGKIPSIVGYMTGSAYLPAKSGIMAILEDTIRKLEDWYKREVDKSVNK